MLQKDKNFDQSKESCRRVFVKGEKRYRIEPLTKTVEQKEPEKPEKSDPIPTIEERVGALEKYVLKLLK